MLAAAAVLRDKPDILDQRIHFAKNDIQPWSPVTEKHLDDGMTNAIKMCGAFVRKGTNSRLAETILANEELTRFSRAI